MNPIRLATRSQFAGGALALLSSSSLLHAQNATFNSSPIANPSMGSMNAATTGANPSNALPTADTVTDIPPADSANAGDASGANSNLLQERTTIDYRAAPLVDVLRHLAAATKINVAVSPAVEGMSANVTVWLTDVTYETALRTVLDIYRLGSVLENGILRIDTLDNLKKEQDDKKRMADEKMKLEPTRILIWPLNYAKAIDIAPIVGNALRSYASIDPRLSVQADVHSNKLIIEGTQAVQVRAKAVIENLDRRKQQITIEARIIEASNQVSRTLKVNWGSRFGMSARNGLTSGIIFPNSVLGTIGGAGEIKDYPVANNAPLPGALGLTLGSINGLLNLDAVLQAYETENLTHIIASPSMTVLDNEKANFQELISIKNMTPVAGAGGTTFDSKLSLEVTPLIAHDGTVELDVALDRDTPTTAPSELMQGKVARNAKTKLAVRNGETAVIGGLYQLSKTKNAGRIPLLGRIPIIGFLFRSNEESTLRTELMLLITPKIHPPMGAGTVANADLQPASAPPSNLGMNAGLNGANATATQTSLNSTAPSNPATNAPVNKATNGLEESSSESGLDIEGENGTNTSNGSGAATPPANNSAGLNGGSLNGENGLNGGENLNGGGGDIGEAPAENPTTNNLESLE